MFCGVIHMNFVLSLQRATYSYVSGHHFFVTWPWPIMLNFLSIMLLSSAQK